MQLGFVQDQILQDFQMYVSLDLSSFTLSLQVYHHSFVVFKLRCDCLEYLDLNFNVMILDSTVESKYFGIY